MKKIKAYNKINSKMWYVSDKLHISKKKRLYSEILDAVYLQHKKGFTPHEIGKFLNIPEPGIKTIFKQLNLKTPSNIPVVKIKSIPGVSYDEKINSYHAYTHIHDEIVILGTYKSKFRVAFKRYQFEGKENTPAAKYVKKRCKNLGCDFCYVYKLKLLPMVCKRAKNANAPKPITETHDEFLTRAKKVVSEKLKEMK